MDVEAEKRSPSDAWLSECDSLDEFGHELMHKLNQRNQFERNSMAYSRVNVQLKQLTASFGARLHALQQQLVQLSHAYKLTQRESERRQRLLDALHYRHKQMNELMANPDGVGRTALLGGQYDGLHYGTNGPNGMSDDSDTNAARNLSADEMRQNQQMLIQHQDRGLDTLADIISRQKFMAHGIGAEIDLQNEIIEDIGEGMEQTNERLVRNTRNIRTVGRKSGSCGYWAVIVLLFVAIVLVSFLPK